MPGHGSSPTVAVARCSPSWSCTSTVQPAALRLPEQATPSLTAKRFPHSMAGGVSQTTTRAACGSAAAAAEALSGGVGPAPGGSLPDASTRPAPLVRGASSC